MKSIINDTLSKVVETLHPRYDKDARVSVIYYPEMVMRNETDSFKNGYRLQKGYDYFGYVFQLEEGKFGTYDKWYIDRTPRELEEAIAILVGKYFRIPESQNEYLK